ncbi:MAG: hypothetical protein AAB352_00350 [Patescibacteria group bacterium]
MKSQNKTKFLIFVVIIFAAIFGFVFVSSAETSYLSCYNNNVYWFNSYGQPQNLYQDCGTNYCNNFGANYCSGAGVFHDRTCYIKGCSFNACQNASYTDTELVKICSSNQACQSGNCVIIQPVYNPPSQYPPQTPPQTQDQNQNQADALSVSMFISKEAQNLQWEKNLSLASGDKVYFMAVVKNNSVSPITNIIFKADIPSEITNLDNIKVDNILRIGDNLSGLNLSAIQPYIAKIITFDGKTQTINIQSQKQVTVNASSGKISNSDSSSVSFGAVLGSSTNSVSKPSLAATIVNFFKEWYLWILVAIVAIFIFIVIFRRLSSDK